MRLLDQLEEDLGRVVIQSSEGARYSLGRLRTWSKSQHLASWASPLVGASVGISCRDNLKLSFVLLALDGIVSRLTLLPSDLPPTLISQIASTTGMGLLISDRHDAHESGIQLHRACPLPDECPDMAVISYNECTSTEWVLATSGTTKRPKLVAHTVATLSRSVKRDQRHGAKLKWGLVYDLSRFAGLQVWFQSLLGGATLIIPAQDKNLTEALSLFYDGGCNSLSATPTLWRKILMTPGSEKLTLRHITLGGEIADQSILSALSVAYPTARIRHIYASTEAGVGFSVTDGKEGFPVSYLENGYTGIIMRVTADGVLEIKPSIKGQQYLGEQNPITDTYGYVNTGDLVRIENDRVYFLGRDSGAINVGGNKVQPEKIEHILLQHPAIALATVLAKPSGITGSLVEARVVLGPDAEDMQNPVQHIRQWCIERLERFEVPALIRIVDEIELNSSGKISRNPSTLNPS